MQMLVIFDIFLYRLIEFMAYSIKLNKTLLLLNYLQNIKNHNHKTRHDSRELKINMDLSNSIAKLLVLKILQIMIWFSGSNFYRPLHLYSLLENNSFL